MCRQRDEDEDEDDGEASLLRDGSSMCFGEEEAGVGGPVPVVVTTEMTMHSSSESRRSRFVSESSRRSSYGGGSFGGGPQQAMIREFVEDMAAIAFEKPDEGASAYSLISDL